jgi:FkbM family methyltransferase
MTATFSEVRAARLPPAPLWVRIAAAIVPRLPAARYIVASQLSRRPPPPFRMRLPKALGGYVFPCDLRDVVSREVCFTGRYEVQETALLQSALRPGMTFVDVGANWGYYTLLAAHLVGPRGRVLSLEPDPRLFRKLHDVVTDNSLAQVTAVQIAAAQQAGTLHMAGYDEHDENFGLSRVVVRASDPEAFAIEGRPLDDLLDEARLGRIDLLKMDVEGFEGAALRGLERSLRDARIDRLLLELHPRQLIDHGDSARQVIASLRGSGYIPWRIDHSQAATRRAAYGPAVPRTFLQPLSDEVLHDDWPHILWLRPGAAVPV